MKAASNIQVREHNRNLVRQELLRLRRATKGALAEATGLSQMTVAAMVADLVERGEAEAGKQVPSGGGRPSVEYLYRGGYRKAAVLYSYQRQGRSFARLQVYDLLGDCLYRDARSFVMVDLNSFDQMLARAWEQVEGISLLALGLPGQAVAGEIVSNDHPALVGKQLLRRYQVLWGVPVLFVNDVNAAAWGFRLRLGVEEIQGEALAAFYFPQRFPPGMGLVIDGKLHTGHQNFVGELQYLSLGVDWTALNHSGQEGVLAMSRMVAAVCSVVAPRRVALYGEFFTPELEASLQGSLKALMPPAYGLEVEACRSLEEDYQAGMKALALSACKEAAFGGAW